MEKIIFQYKPRVEQYLDDLVYVLFQEEYFSYKESSPEYVQKIINGFKNTIVARLYKPTPGSLIAHGEYYVKYNAGKRTTWYIFFSQKGNKCLVKYITNNHVADAAFLQHF